MEVYWEFHSVYCVTFGYCLSQGGKKRQICRKVPFNGIAVEEGFLAVSVSVLHVFIISQVRRCGESPFYTSEEISDKNFPRKGC